MAYTFTTNGSYIDFKDSGVLVRKLSTASRCIEWGYDNTTPLMVSFEIDNLDYPNIRITDIYFDGVQCATQADFGTNIATMFPGYAAGSVVGYPAGTKIYMALLTQSGTDAPVATVLQNTLGGTVAFTYSGEGDYSGTLAGAFLAAKTVVSFSNPRYGACNLTAYRFDDNTIKMNADSDYESTTIPFVLQIIVYP